MDIFCYIVSVLLCAGGIAGCFLPVIPGPPLAMAGYLILLFTPASAGMHWITVLVLGVLTLLTVVSDYIIPVLGVRWFGALHTVERGVCSVHLQDCFSCRGA